MKKENRVLEDCMTSVMRVAMAGIAAIAWFALALQLYLEVVRALAGSLSIAVIVIRYFSFFTILTNLLVALCLTVALSTRHSRAGKFLSSAVTQAGIAVFIAIVGAIYFLLLRHVWDPQGAQKLADILLHDVVPLAYVIYWLSLAPRTGLRWRHAFWWLGYPIAYMIYTFVRGFVTGWYPYPFVDAAALGFPRAMANAAWVLLAFLVLGLAAVAIGRRDRAQYH